MKQRVKKSKNEAMTIPYFQKNRKGDTLTSDKSKKEAATINWSQHFEPQFIRRIEAIKRHNNPAYGHIEYGHYLDERLLGADDVYETDDLFIVMERQEVANRSEILPFMKGTLVQHLVRIDAALPNGFQILKTVGEAQKYPYEENRLIAVILADPELLSSVRLVK